MNRFRNKSTFMAKRVIPLFFCYILHIKSEYIISYHHITWGSITYSGLVLSNLSNEEGKGRSNAMGRNELKGVFDIPIKIIYVVNITIETICAPFFPLPPSQPVNSPLPTNPSHRRRLL